MWPLRIQFYNKESILNKLANKYKLILYGYPLNSHIKNNKLFVLFAGNVVGEEKNKKNFLKELKKLKEIKNFDVKKDFLIINIEQPLAVSKLYSSDLIHIEPIKCMIWR